MVTNNRLTRRDCQRLADFPKPVSQETALSLPFLCIILYGVPFLVGSELVSHKASEANCLTHGLYLCYVRVVSFRTTGQDCHDVM